MCTENRGVSGLFPLDLEKQKAQFDLRLGISVEVLAIRKHNVDNCFKVPPLITSTRGLQVWTHGTRYRMPKGKKTRVRPPVVQEKYVRGFVAKLYKMVQGFRFYDKKSAPYQSQ